MFTLGEEQTFFRCESRDITAGLGRVSFSADGDKLAVREKINDEEYNSTVM